MSFPKALFTIFLLLSSVLRAEDYVVGEKYKVDIDEVRPTQVAVGFKEIENKVEKIAEADEGDLGDYKREKAGTAVVGPNGQLFLVDGHHFARALQKYGSKTMWVTIVANYSDLAPKEFWAKMQSKKYVHLADQHGKKITTAQLPRTIAGMKNDPYRSLAWMVRKAGGYHERKAPFQEFFWADYFRKRVRLTANPSTARWKSALDEALELARSDSARHLPGWHGRRAARCAEMLGWLSE